jgi:hypothetical protein
MVRSREILEKGQYTTHRISRLCPILRFRLSGSVSGKVSRNTKKDLDYQSDPNERHAADLGGIGQASAEY